MTDAQGLTVAVTGASGRLGGAVLERLSRDAEIGRVVALDRAPLKHALPKVEFRKADVRERGFDAHLAGCDALVHLAFIVESGSRDRALVQEVNVGGTRNVLDAAAKAGVRRVVYASSIASYGFHEDNRDTVLDETAPIRGNPEFYYSQTKAEVEGWLDKFEAEHPEIALARIRPTMFLSGDPDDPGMGLFRAPVFAYVGGGDAPTQAAHESDVADAFVLALKKGARGAYNVAVDDRGLPPSAMGRAMGKPSIEIPPAALALYRLAYKAGLVDIDPLWLGFASSLPIVASSKKIRKELGWKPRYDSTGAVLRAVAGRPVAGASRGVKLFLGSGALATRVLGGLTGSERERYEIRSIKGTLNLQLTGDHPSDWHFTFNDGIVGIHPGLAPDAVATTTLREETLLDLLSGKARYSTIQMTGKVRFKGEGNLSFFLPGMIEGFGRMLRARGLVGLPLRMFARTVLRASGRERVKEAE